MEVEFNNVTVTVTADTPKAAYTKLCSMLSKDGVEFTTDTFDTHGADGNLDSSRSTRELFLVLGEEW